LLRRSPSSQPQKTCGPRTHNSPNTSAGASAAQLTQLRSLLADARQPPRELYRRCWDRHQSETRRPHRTSRLDPGYRAAPGRNDHGGDRLPEAPRPRQRLIHIHADAEELGQVYQADLMFNSGMPQIAAALAAMQAVKTNAEAAPWRAAITLPACARN